LHGAGLPGKPDVVMRKYKVVVFVHGCFWHRHAGCKIATIPKGNTGFWLQKFAANVERDRRNISSLENQGWHVFMVWECELVPSKILETAHTLAFKILSGHSTIDGLIGK
jgi:DNA mismatch endonuclease (patch repair protein)